MTLLIFFYVYKSYYGTCMSRDFFGTNCASIVQSLPDKVNRVSLGSFTKCIFTVNLKSLKIQL